MDLAKLFNSPQFFDRIAGFLLGLMSTLLIGGLKEMLETHGIWVILIIFALFLICVMLARKLRMLRKTNIDVAIRNPITMMGEEEKEQYARKVFIGFVPLFNGRLKKEQDFEDPEIKKQIKQEAIANFDFDKFDIASSNFQPTIKAIVAHKSKLKHCWLITTDASAEYAEFLVKYLKKEENIKCEFNYGKKYKLTMDEESLVVSKTYDLLARIFQEIPKNIQLTEVITDITTGIKSMSLGTILACLDKERDIEFIGTRYDSDGFLDRKNPLHKPIIFSFDPQLKNQE